MGPRARKITLEVSHEYSQLLRCNPACTNYDETFGSAGLGGSRRPLGLYESADTRRVQEG